jgi:carboxyl-terminal processing protease
MPRSYSKSTIIIIAIIALGGSFFIGFKYGEANKPAVEKVTDLTDREDQKPATVDFSPFWKVWSLIDEKFVSKSTTTVLTQDKVWGAIEGLANSLGDPFTVFMPPEENKFFESEIAGSFEGVGMEIGNKDGALVVISPLKDTPAYRAGIEPGDKILKIDDTSSINMNSDQAVKLIRGQKGTAVRLLLDRVGKKQPFEVKVIRDTIQIPTIDTKLQFSSSSTNTAPESGLRKDGIFVISLYNFSEPSPNLFRNALRQFILTGSDKLILDLRGNPGGYLEAAIDMASWFLPAGKVIVREDFGGKQPEEISRSRGYNIFNKNLKMIILVNGGSASASEILAGALQEQGVAKLVGTKTFGKGSVQELVKITPDTSFKVTIAKWLTPNGKSISDGGLTPDYLVELTDKDREAKRDPQMEKAIQLLNQM